jgi:3-hydroxyisobutyrate dehydrogenase
MIAFLGMGLLGSNFVRAMLDRNLHVQVWNRSIEKAKSLEPAGARVFSSPAEAVKGAQQVHLTLSDDAAVDAILEQARPGLLPGTIIIDHTTTSPTGAAKRSALWKERGYVFLHAPVFMGPQNAREATGIMMVSGDPDAIRMVEPELARMTGKLVNLGPSPDKAAIMKLLGNLFLMSLTGGVSDLFALAKANGIASVEAASLFDWFNPAATFPARVKRILDANFDQPSWELTMARKDARLMMESAGLGGTTLSVIPAR